MIHLCGLGGWERIHRVCVSVAERGDAESYQIIAYDKEKTARGSQCPLLVTEVTISIFLHVPCRSSRPFRLLPHSESPQHSASWPTSQGNQEFVGTVTDSRVEAAYAESEDDL